MDHGGTCHHNRKSLSSHLETLNSIYCYHPARRYPVSPYHYHYKNLSSHGCVYWFSLEIVYYIAIPFINLNLLLSSRSK